MQTRFIIILVLLALAEYYGYVLVRSMVKNMSNVPRLSILGVYITLTVFTWFSFILFRQIHWANLPHMIRNIYVAFGMGWVVAKLVVMLVMLIDDIRRLLTWLVTTMTLSNSPNTDVISNPIERSLFLKRTAVLLGGLTLTGFFAGVSNRYRYRVRTVKMNFKSLPASFKGLKIVQISDVHTGSFDNHHAVAHGIDRILDQKPDIIFFTGDLVNNVATEVTEKFQEIFSRLKAPLGVYSVLGNHDYGDYVQWESKEDKIRNLEDLKGIHHKMGWRLMMNEHIVFERNNEKIAVVGIENWGAKANFPKYGDLNKAVDGLKEKNVPFSILLSHDPSHWDAQIRPKFPEINLTLSGHTHGMQFGVDSKWLKWSPVQYIYKQWAGHYSEGEQSLYVNRGFGFLGYPGRLGILPEITVIELV